MARRRQALKCSGRRTDGQPCGAYAIVGGFVCMAHGGATPAVRRAARFRVIEQQCIREFKAAKARWQRDLTRWHAERVAVTSRRLGIPAASVTDADIVACIFLHGVPGKPRPVMRTDRRYGPRRPTTERTGQ